MTWLTLELFVVVHSFSSDWLRGWREFSGPITERSKDKPMQFRITFDTQLKIFVNITVLGGVSLSFEYSSRTEINSFSFC